jgi:hypothetical protein
MYANIRWAVYLIENELVKGSFSRGRDGESHVETGNLSLYQSAHGGETCRCHATLRLVYRSETMG